MIIKYQVFLFSIAGTPSNDRILPTTVVRLIVQRGSSSSQIPEHSLSGNFSRELRGAPTREDRRNDQFPSSP